MALRNPIKRPGKPDPSAVYEPVLSYSGPEGTYNSGMRLRGDHPAVRAAFGSWMLADLPDDQKGQLRNAALFGDVVPEPGERSDEPLAQPPAGRFRALRSWRLADPDLQQRARINAGEIVTADDEVYRRYPHLFVRETEER